MSTYGVTIAIALVLFLGPLAAILLLAGRQR